MLKFSSDFDILKKQFEAFVQKRKLSEFKKHFNKNYKHFYKSPDDFRLACEWLRRLGLFRLGLRFCGFSYRVPPRLNISEPLNSVKLFWMARFLWACGCHQYAQLLLSRISTFASEDQKALADIYQTRGEYQKAIESLTVYLAEVAQVRIVVAKGKLKINPQTKSLIYSTRMTLISLADSYAGLEDFATAFSILDCVEEYSQQSTPTFEPLVLGICRQARAEFFCHQKQFDLALREIQKAEPFFIEDDESLDHLFFIKWKAYILSQAGGENHLNLASKLFAQGRNILERKRVRPEVLIDYLRLETEAKRKISRKTKDRKNTTEHNSLLKLSWYPGLAASYRKKCFAGLNNELMLTNKNVRYRIFLSADEFVAVEEGLRTYLLPLELKLAGWVKVCGDIGLSFYRAFELLWPTEVNSFFELENRLKSLIHRCRTKYGLPIHSKNKTLIISEDSPIEVHLKDNQYPTFLQHREFFASRELDQYYNLKSRSHRAVLLKYWIEKDWIKKNESNKQKGFFYKVLIARNCD